MRKCGDKNCGVNSMMACRKCVPNAFFYGKRKLEPARRSNKKSLKYLNNRIELGELRDFLIEWSQEVSLGQMEVISGVSRPSIVNILNGKTWVQKKSYGLIQKAYENWKLSKK